MKGADDASAAEPDLSTGSPSRDPTSGHPGGCRPGRQLVRIIERADADTRQPVAFIGCLAAADGVPAIPIPVAHELGHGQDDCGPDTIALDDSDAEPERAAAWTVEHPPDRLESHR